jgi:hypothetical protein
MSFYYFPSSGGGGGDADPIGAVYRFNTNTNMDTSWAVVSPGTQIYESSPAVVTNPTTNWKFTVPTGGAGLYIVGYTAYISVVGSAVAAGGFIYATNLHFGASGADQTRLTLEVSNGAANYSFVGRGFATLPLNDGDTVQFKFIKTNSAVVQIGSPNDYDSRFFVHRVGDK